MYRFILLLFILNSYSQDRAMVPTSGTIVFRKDRIVTDSIAYERSTKELSKKMIESMKNEFEKKASGETDEIKKEQFSQGLEYAEKTNLYLEFYGDDFGIYRFYTTFKGDKIEYCYSIDNEIQNDTVVYDTKYLPIKFESHEWGGEFLYPIVEIIDIKEFRNDKKEIESYSCFKVELTYKEHFAETDWENFRNDLIQRKELWVTEKIKASMHPVLHAGEILEKYYPLEIIEYEDEVEGYKTLYKLEKFDVH